jgi:5'-nucleotidase
VTDRAGEQPAARLAGIPRILVTNDDGIDAVGLHHLARALRPHGHVTIVAPDTDCSGASAAFGPLHLIRPEVREADVPGVDRAFSVNGPPALCVLFARLGAFGERPDLVVSGINPGANVGRSVYHSGTVGAALTARNGGISGVAISQEVADIAVEGQGWDDTLAAQVWESAASVGAAVGAALLARPPARPVVVNVNVPNLPLGEVKGWRRTEVGTIPLRAVAAARLEVKPGHTDTFRVVMEYGPPNALPADVDGGAVMDGYVSVSWLSRLLDDTDVPGAGRDPASDEEDGPDREARRIDVESVDAVAAGLDGLLAP